MLITFDYHIHSYYSFDSLNKPLEIIKTALKKGINAISVTDHDTIKGSLEAKKLSKQYNILVITGIELKTDAGDLIILGIDEELKNYNFYEIIDIAYSNQWLTILPHPYVRHHLSDDFIKIVEKKVSAIEGFNCRAFSISNSKAIKLAETLKKPITAGSDAHLLKEIGNGINYILVNTISEEDLFKGIKNGWIRIEARHSNPLYHFSSSLIKVPKFFLRAI
ncbi:MAG: PHP domain-containing protein [Thermoproteota archaeon]|jgi:predicted metal-dependent phosphoesterase TrpH|nr:PHP domain-containing protein [Thermoproteota archaeon]